jgi:host cell surface-exposed lipoprotein
VTIIRGIAAVGAAAAVLTVVSCGSSGDATFVGTAAVGTPKAFPTEIIPTDDPVTLSPTSTAAKPKVVVIPPAARTPPPAPAPTTPPPAPVVTTPPAPVYTPPPPPPPPPAAETVSQSNAVGKGQEYLDFTSFSRQGLIGQLVFEGFSTADATYAVDTISPDWNVQAAKKAKEYLNLESFSHQGLVEQLTFEGFTPEQAEFGVSQAGL